MRGVESGHQIFFVAVSQRDERVRRLKALAQKQLLIGSVAADDRGLFERLVEYARFFFVVFDKLRLHARFVQNRAQIIRYAAAADYKRVLCRLRVFAYVFEKRRNGRVVRRDEQAVARLYHEIALWDQGFVVPAYAAEQHARHILLRLVYLGERRAHKRLVAIHAHLNHFNQSAHERLYAGYREGQTQHAADFTRGRALRICDVVYRKLLRHEGHVFQVLRLTDARDCVLRAQLFAYRAAQHVAFVAYRYGDKHVRVLYVRFLKRTYADRVALYRQYV